MGELVIDMERIDRDVSASILRITRDRRIRTAIDTPMRERTSMQAALVAVGRLIQAGFCT